MENEIIKSHKKLALKSDMRNERMAKKSIVLLKNNNELLPLKKSGKKIALIGALAADKTSP